MLLSFGDFSIGLILKSVLSVGILFPQTGIVVVMRPSSKFEFTANCPDVPSITASLALIIEEL